MAKEICRIGDIQGKANGGKVVRTYQGDEIDLMNPGCRVEVTGEVIICDQDRKYEFLQRNTAREVQVAPNVLDGV